MCAIVYLCVLICHTCCTRVPFPLQYPVIESLFEREAKRVVYVDTRVGIRAQEKKDRDEEEASRKQQVRYVTYIHNYVSANSGTTIYHKMK